MITRWGIIGAGHIADRVLPDMRIVFPSVVAVASRSGVSAQLFAERHEISFATNDVDALLRRDDIDAVYVATPTPTHRSLAVQALNAGKHVLVEKPMAESAEGVAAIFEAARRARRFAMEAMWMRFNPLHRAVLERVSRGVIGEVRSVRASFGMPPRTPENVVKSTPSAWLDRGIYAVTLAHWFLGKPDTVTARGTVADGVDLAGHATLDYLNGAHAQLACSSREYLDLSATISGPDGLITIDPMFWMSSSATVRSGSLAQVLREAEHLALASPGRGYSPMFRAIADAFRAGHLQHPEHDEAATVAVAATIDEVRSQILASVED